MHRVAKGRTQLKRLSMYIQAWRGLGFPGGSAVKNPPPVQETWVSSLGWEDLEKEIATHSSILA